MNMPPYTEAISRLERDRDILIHNANVKDLPLSEMKPLLDAASELQDAITLLKLSSFGGLTALVSLVRQWGVDKGITGPNGKATLESQFKKLLEEVYEIEEGIVDGDQHELIDGIGDSTVVLILLAEIAGVKFETCLLAAYDEIKARTGRMENGQFIKDKP